MRDKGIIIMCNSPFSAFYIFWAIGFVLFFVIMHLLKNNKSDSEGKSKSEHSSSTIDKLSKIKSLKESNSSTESTESKNITNSEETEPKKIIAPREERITKEQTTEINNSKKTDENTPFIDKYRTEQNKASDSPTSKKKDINFVFISAIAIRVLAIVAFFTAYSFWNNLVLSISMIFAMLIPFVGGAFCHFFLLCLPFIAAFSPNYELSQSIILLIIFVLYIPCLLCFLYSSFIFKFDSRKKIISVMAVVLSAAAVFLGVMQFNKPNQIVSSSVPATTIKLNDISSYVSPGDTAHISVTAKPNTEYSISVEYSSGFSEAEGLENKTADSTGRVSWSWKVGTNTYSGEYPVTITNHKDLTESETFYFTVK